ncbi:uncharacterized protein UHOD_11807 [Ustilago sp. UG-2017b]|nr:uncharacterized protein UHOD_11807 [Ustilago sp. UG-2017b]
MIPNPFPRVLLISFFLATLSLAFNPGSKRGHLNRRGDGQSATPLQPGGPSSSSPFIPSPPPSTDVSSSLRHTLNPPSDLSTGFRRSFSLPNNFAPLSSHKPALDPPSTANTAEEAGKGENTAFVANKAEAEIKETYPSDQNLAPISRKKVMFSSVDDVFPPEMYQEEVSTPLPLDSPTQNPAPSAPGFSSRLAKVKDSISPRFAPVQEKMRIHLASLKAHTAKVKDSISSRYASVQEKMRIHMVNLKDQYARAKNPKLANYYTTGGKPAIFGFEELGLGKTIPYEARVAAQKFGEARVFYDPKNYEDQVRLVYTGPSPGGSTAPSEMFRTYLVPKDKALPLPKPLRQLGLRETMSLFKQVDEGTSYPNVPESSPTRLRTKPNWWTAMARPVGPNQQQMDHHPVAGRWNRLGDRVGSAWGRMKTASSKIPESMRGLFKNPSVSGAREFVRPIPR